MQFPLGEFELSVVSDGVFRIDGGTVFGVVPRVLWEKLAAPDELNRVPLGLNSLVVRTPDALVLVETGIGTKLREKMRRFHDFGDGTLVPELAKIGIRPDDIDVVILTHLHFDHCGGNTLRDGDAFCPTFPSARYVIQKREWADAIHPNGLTCAGYLPENFAALEDDGRLQLIDGDAEVVPGVTCRLTGGHTRAHQMVIVESAGRTACYPGDVMPGTWWLKPNYITAYDLSQEKTYAVKVKLLEDACSGRWIMVWGHDHDNPVTMLERRGDEVAAVRVETA